MNISRIRFIRDDQGLWYWQYVDERHQILAESAKLTDNLEVAVMQAAIVTGLKIEMSYDTETFGDVLTHVEPQRIAAIGIEVQLP